MKNPLKKDIERNREIIRANRLNMKNPLKKDIERGREIIRKEGINFTTFKERLGALFTNPKSIDEDGWVRMYDDYAELRGSKLSTGACIIMTVEEFAEEMFQDWTEEAHDTMLKSKKR